MPMKSILVVFALFSFVLAAYPQRVIPLYEGEIPNAILGEDNEIVTSTNVSKVSHPTLTMYLPQEGKSNGTAVIICPGGGYGSLVMKREGYDVAERFANVGVTAFVLKYRLPDDKIMQDKSIGPLQDAQQAILMVRKNAEKWKVDPAKIGIMGFSAGGHLASTAGTHFNQVQIENREGISVRPDFMILIYPVISFQDSITHRGSREKLLGNPASTDLIKLYSNDLQVTSDTPPTFLVHAGDDVVVPVENSLRLYEALRKNAVPSALHIYTRGGHGFLSYPPVEEWFGRCMLWMNDME